MKKVLIITYYWPPGSGAGVQRWLKFSKYLPSFGWEPVILTVDPEFAAYPAIDNSLETEISSDLKIYKTRATDYFRIYNKDKKKIPSAGFASNDSKGIKGKIMRFIRGNFFIPDPRKGWNKCAFRKACEIIDNEDIKYIITTSPPHSTQLIGLKLKNKYPGIRWIADLRDPWTDIYYYNQFYHTFIAKIIDRKYENQVFQSADKIITVGKSLKDLFAAKIPGIKNKSEVITNGFDEDDFKDLISTNPEKFTISYIGTLSDSYPIRGFLDALNGFREKGNDFNLKFVGTVSPEQKELILSKIEKSSVEFIPYVDHAIAIKYMLDTNALLLIIPDHQSNKSIITGKLFEYIASGKPVICLGPVDGDAAEIIKEACNNDSFKYDDISGIEAFLVTLISNPGIYKNHTSSGFSRQNLTSKLVNILKGV
jgi:glycosyltransferase involved in cell wall biosynthesis